MDAFARMVGVVPAQTLLAHDGLSFLQGIVEGACRRRRWLTRSASA
ncbi:MAG: hypothetical protein M5U33_04810 [Pseudorhodoplanes sp.]|nr:hypothetical protein [Pseudorhodoplanes sp.]